MGDHDVSDQVDESQLRAFTKALLEDIHALDRMLEEGRFETGVRRIGAEQEMFLVDGRLRPAPIAVELLESLDEPRLTTELARYNLEANLSPQIFGGSCLRRMQEEVEYLLARTSEAARAHGARVLLAGILPTLRKTDLGLDNMCPMPRYHALNNAMSQLRKGDFQVNIKGTDELRTSHDNVMLESCNTSFQIHFQVAPSEFARLYNLAQTITAPVLAAAVNSPVLLKHRLWCETRVALFEGSVDTRSEHHHERGLRPRVHFGDDWVKDSVLEIFREDIARFRVVLAPPARDESPDAVLERGEVPRLSALRLHSGTVYRWNRACYGVADGVAHLRIENRVLPAGPSVEDEMANAALYYGLMASFADEFDRIDEVMRFDDAKTNFFAAARHGLRAQFHWLDGKLHTAADLLLKRLVPRAREGLQSAQIDAGDIEHYLGIISARVESRQTGARWILDSLNEMDHRGEGRGEHPLDVRYHAIARATLEGQDGGEPVHRWPLAHVVQDSVAWKENFRTVGQIMSTDLFTVRPEDILDLAANLMEWKHVRHVPVEDEDGRLVGLVSHRAMLRLVARGLREGAEAVVSHVMRSDPLTATPDTPTLDAIRLMRDRKVSCLPVVDPNDRLVGIVTERDLIAVSANLLEKFLQED